MPNGIKYVLMAAFFFAVTKVLQVTVFDSKHYERLEKESATRYSDNQKKKKAQKSKITKKKEGSELENKSNLTGKGKAADSVKVTINSNTEVSLSSLKNNYLAPLLAKIPEGQLREDIVIRYYRHKKDLKKVDRLKELSYYIHEKEAVETSGLGSNIIYYGDDVPLEDIQIIALTLLEEKIPLKSIQHTKFEWKAKAIEIGTDVALIEKPNISIREIQEFHKQYVHN